jgi:serine/threonine-protein kinase
MSVPDLDRLTFVRGDVIDGRYQAVHRVAKGGMGEVWAARHLALDELFALKLLAPTWGVAEDALSRFDLEARVGANLGRRSHHIVPVIDHGWHHGRPFLVMPFIDGPSVEQLLAYGPLGVAETTRIVRHVTRALMAAHSIGVLHRDLKPANILLEYENGRFYARVSDFGIAKPERNAALHREYVTLRGVFVGTPAIMSPERATGDELDHRCDVWSLSCVAYRCLVGHDPFEGGSVLEILGRVCTGDFEAPSAARPELPPALDAVFARAFAVDINERFPDAASFDDAFAQACGVSREPRSVPPIPLETRRAPATLRGVIP